jgi:hypothetical protein
MPDRSDEQQIEDLRRRVAAIEQQMKLIHQALVEVNRHLPRGSMRMTARN